MMEFQEGNPATELGCPLCFGRERWMASRPPRALICGHLPLSPCQHIGHSLEARNFILGRPFVRSSI
jgi:hypothetical protein